MKRVSWSAGSGGFYPIGRRGAKHVGRPSYPLPLRERVAAMRSSSDGWGPESAVRDPSSGASRPLLPEGDYLYLIAPLLMSWSNHNQLISHMSASLRSIDPHMALPTVLGHFEGHRGSNHGAQHLF